MALHGVTIRKGNEGDLAKVGRLWLAMTQELAPSFTPNLDWWRKMARAHMQGGNYTMLVAEAGQKIIGFIDWFLYPEPSTGKVHAVGQHFYVAPEARRGKTAWALYAAAEGVVEMSAAKVMELFCFEKEQPMWAKRGYRPLRTLMRKEMNGEALKENSHV